MFKPFKTVTLIFTAIFAGTVQAEDAFTQALAGGKVSFNARYRIETVDQDNVLDNAFASTIRTRLGYQTSDWNNFSAFLEIEDVHAFIKSDYNIPGDIAPRYSVVADPTDTELNQSYLSYQANDTTFRYGNQRIIYDDARFVGNVGWRQNEQTYEGLSVVNKSLADITFSYAYITNVNDILFRDTNMSNHLLNAELDNLGPGKLTVYGYFLEYDNPAQVTASNQTLGARYAGSVGNTLKFLFAGSLAQQSNYADGSNIIDAGYFLLEGGVGLKNGIELKAGLELLEGDGLYAFQTPLATKHVFNGWADLFLNTPANGLQDIYLSASGSIKNIKYQAVYHNFSPDTSGTDYGSEIDLIASRQINKNYAVGVKLARYSADNFSVDTNKLWLWAEAKF